MSRSYCFGCGTEVEEDAKVCPKCGRSFEEVPPPPVAPQIPEVVPEPEILKNPPVTEEETSPREEAPADEKSEKETSLFNARLFFVRKLIGLMIVINGLLGLDIYVRYAIKYAKRGKDIPLLILTVVIDILFLISVILGNRIMKERKPGRGEVLVKQRSTAARKVAGVLILIPIALFSVKMFGMTIEEITDSYTYLEDVLEMMTIDIMCLSYLGIGIKMFFPRTVIEEAPYEGENISMESESIEK